VIAGEGDQRPQLEAFRATSGLASRIHLPGHRADVGDLQAAAHVLVMPSLWEGLPLAILEGMFAGNAVVASNASGIPEAVRDGVDGLLVPPGDVDALAGALHTLLEDAALRKRMGASAAAHARSRFSIRRMMDDYEALYLG
jgi:glycosyltransferase involved in cell wall biosynthesis